MKLMKNLTWIVGLAAALALAPACGDDEETVDAPPATIDAPPTGDVDAPPTGDVDAPPGAAGTCEAYCAAVTASCTDANEQYDLDPDADSMTECMAYCGAIGWEAGVDTDTDGNTIGCRTYHATAAASDPATHCIHAGPTGGAMCGDACEVYCANYAANCADGFTADYTDAAGCMTACAAFADVGTPGDTTGDTTYCRVYHSGLPSFTDADTHCDHSGATPTAQCVAP